MAASDTKQGDSAKSAGSEPELIGLQLLPQKLGPISAGAAAVFACVAGYGFYYSGSQMNSQKDGKGDEAVTHYVSASDVRGAFLWLPPELSKGTKRVLGFIDMPKPEQDRLTEELEKGRLRIAALWLWDNQAEDGDAVSVSVGGFSQTIGIYNKPTMYYIPVQTGANVRITAITDGGGGVTLGVRTIVGPYPLPPLAVGQSLEVPIL